MKQIIIGTATLGLAVVLGASLGLAQFNSKDSPYSKSPSPYAKTPSPYAKPSYQPPPPPASPPPASVPVTTTAPAATSLAVSDADVAIATRVEWGQAVHGASLPSVTTDVTCDGHVDRVVGYLDRDNPDGLRFHVMVVTRHGNLDQAPVASFDFTGETAMSLCDESKPPRLSVDVLEPKTVQELSGYAACTQGIRVEDDMCHALYLFWMPDKPGKTGQLVVGSS